MFMVMNEREKAKTKMMLSLSDGLIMTDLIYISVAHSGRLMITIKAELHRKILIVSSFVPNLHEMCLTK